MNYDSALGKGYMSPRPLRITDPDIAMLRRLVGARQLSSLYTMQCRVQWPYVYSTAFALSLGPEEGFVNVENEPHESPANVHYGRLRFAVEPWPRYTQPITDEQGRVSMGHVSTVSLIQHGRKLGAIEQIDIYECTEHFLDDVVRYDAAVVFRFTHGFAFCLSPERGGSLGVQFTSAWEHIWELETDYLHELRLSLT